MIPDPGEDIGPAGFGLPVAAAGQQRLINRYGLDAGRGAFFRGFQLNGPRQGHGITPVDEALA